ncbi:ubiquitin-activating enzyme e1, putative [Eimeria brunetti]|uniref:Ubiquitin-activating enzyme e1, putative n=1 Tax=Eimeria brunetti TaxID=51314 RepID=U6LCA2_9EIME|nr:ubiquitin-activating enzyme e1, putative [Eimeria brunetti]
MVLLHEEGLEKMTLLAESFSKDSETNGHVDFVHAAATLRAANYKISFWEKFKTKQIAGRITPAIATTTAAVTGLAALEFLKVVQWSKTIGSSGKTIKDCDIAENDIQKKEKKNINHISNFIHLFKNSFLNLALPLWLFSEPVPPIRNVDKDYEPIAGGPVRALPQGFTCWDKVEGTAG